MINIPNYLIQEIIYQGKSSLIFRAYDEITTRNVVIKLLNEEYPTPNQLARFQYEYEISKKLYQLEPEKMLRIYEIIKHNNSLALVVEDFSAKSLDRFLIKAL